LRDIPADHNTAINQREDRRKTKTTMPTKVPKVLCHFCQKEFVDIRKHYRRNAECNRQNEKAEAEAKKLRQQLEVEALKPKEANKSSNHYIMRMLRSFVCEEECIKVDC
jgi:hypothetical protein